jgi:hypothetical protein
MCPTQRRRGPMFQSTHSRDGGDDFRLDRSRRRPGGSARAADGRRGSVSVSVSVSVFVFVSLSYTVLGSPVCSLVGMKDCYLAKHEWQEQLRVSERRKGWLS